MDKNRLRNAILNATSRNAALVIKNANIVNVFTGTIEKGDVAVRDGITSTPLRRMRAEAGNHHCDRRSP